MNFKLIKRRQSQDVVPAGVIEQRILVIRGQKVMLDGDLAELYGVQTKALNLAVRRNRDRFPEDFMFQLTRREAQNLRFQIETSSWGGRRYSPLAFTQEGVAMLSSVLHSERAIKINIGIIRVFVRLREILASHKELARKLDEMQRKYDEQFSFVFDEIRKFVNHGRARRRPIGFLAGSR